VRICYDPGDHVILRLAIRDYTGPTKDYSKSTLFPPEGEGPEPKLRRPPEWVNWFGNLVIALYLLDIIGILALFRPYLRTFFTLKTREIAACPIPATLEPGKKLKLRNSLICWDKERRTIWLRPRGFNMLQMPEMVAKLITDADSKAIIGRKNLFSSGSPIVMAVFLWTAYQLFSATMPFNGKGLSAGEFVGLAALMFLFFGLLSLRVTGKRMDRLVEDALGELTSMSGSGARTTP